MAWKWHNMQGCMGSQPSLCSSGTAVPTWFGQNRWVLAPNLLFPCIQLYLQGLQHPAPPYGAFLPCAPVLRWGCKHPGLQSSSGKNGQQQQHQTVAAGNGRDGRRLWRSMGNRNQSCRRPGVLNFLPTSCQQHCGVIGSKLYSFLMLFARFLLRTAFPRIKLAFPMKGLNFPPVSVVH